MVYHHVTPWSIIMRMRLRSFGRDHIRRNTGQCHITVNINSDYLVLSIVATYTSIFPNLVVIKFAGKSVKTGILG